MGSREWEIITQDTPSVGRDAEMAAVNHVIERQEMLLPSFVSGTGPYPSAEGRWLSQPLQAEERRAAAGLYQALMTATCLEMIGSRGPIVVEGPFSINEVFLTALHTLTKRPIHASLADTGTALGASLLAGTRPAVHLRRVSDELAGLTDYAERWRDAARS